MKPTLVPNCLHDSSQLLENFKNLGVVCPNVKLFTVDTLSIYSKYWFCTCCFHYCWDAHSVPKCSWIIIKQLGQIDDSFKITSLWGRCSHTHHCPFRVVRNKACRQYNDDRRYSKQGLPTLLWQNWKFSIQHCRVGQCVRIIYYTNTKHIAALLLVCHLWWLNKQVSHHSD